MARHVEDLSLFLSVLTESNGDESISAQSQGSALLNMRGWRVASFVSGRDNALTVETAQAVAAALRALSDAGLEIVEDEPPGLKRASELWPALFSHASISQLRELYAGQEGKAGKVVRAVLSAAANSPQASPEDFARAWGEREALLSALLDWMKATPLIVAPVGATPAFEHGARRVKVGDEVLSVYRAFDYSRAFNVLGLPSVSVPAGRTREGLPIGVQIIGRPFAEVAVLAAASIIEAALGGWKQPPLA
jgi:amidase